MNLLYVLKWDKMKMKWEIVDNIVDNKPLLGKTIYVDWRI